MNANDVQRSKGLARSYRIKAGVLVVLLGLAAAITDTMLVEMRGGRAPVALAPVAANPAEPYYFPAQFDVRPAAAEPHVDAF